MVKVLAAVAWPYANGPRHIGHVAGFGVPSDVFSRYMRLAGHDVFPTVFASCRSTAPELTGHQMLQRP